MPVWRDFFSLFPTYVGVIQNGTSYKTRQIAVPHVCGGDPFKKLAGGYSADCSPRVWGWSSPKRLLRVSKALFPTGVGVIPWSCIKGGTLISVPHECGGDPQISSARLACQYYSPRMWGWSLLCHAHWVRHLLFPTYVGVVLADRRTTFCTFSVPHECGGKSN